MTHRFDPRHMERLLNPERRKILDPQKVLSYLNLGGSQVLADVGCGPGFFTLEAARLLGPGGKVLAIDVSQEMLDACQRRAAEAGITSVQTVLAEADDEIPLHSGVCDAALLVNVYHEIDPTAGTMNEVRRILKPGGLLFIVDWIPQETPTGPPVAERVDPQDVTEELTAAGFVLQGTCEVGPYNYGLKFYSPGGITDMENPVR